MSSLSTDKEKSIIKGLEEIQSSGGNIIQIFVSNPVGRQGKLDIYKDIGPNIKKYLKKTKCKIVIHSSYLLNFAKNDNHNNIKTLYNELIVADQIGAIGCVIHVGKYLELNLLNAKENMYSALIKIMDDILDAKLKIKVLLETCAGQGTELFPTENNSIDELAEFYNRFPNKYKKILNICVDTCHIHSAGYNMSDKDNVKKFFNEFKKKIGIKNLGLIHINDSKTPFNSHVDRHQELGKGSIGLIGLKEVVINAIDYKIPLILETPNNGYIREIPWMIGIKLKK
jgi:deoxyribonuclease-4